MSTPLALRREAASYVSTHAGLPGEIVVDTTNQRPTLQDGSTLGGFPIAAVSDLKGSNAGINTNFGINQRVYASGTALAAGAYAHDRHKAGAGGCTYTFSQAVPDTTITITAGTLIQAIDAPNVYASSFWLTWTGTAQARVWQGSASGSYSSGISTKVDGVTVNALLVTGLSVGTIANVEFSTGTLGTTRPWQFEAALSGAGPTRYDRRHGEMELCQRYYFALSAPNATIFFNCLSAGSNLFGLLLTFPSAMRASPTCTIAGSVSSGSFAGNAPYVSLASSTAAYLHGDMSVTQAYAFLTTFTASAEI